MSVCWENEEKNYFDLNRSWLRLVITSHDADCKFKVKVNDFNLITAQVKWCKPDEFDNWLHQERPLRDANVTRLTNSSSKHETIIFLEFQFCAIFPHAKRSFFIFFVHLERGKITAREEQQHTQIPISITCSNLSSHVPVQDLVLQFRFLAVGGNYLPMLRTLYALNTFSTSCSSGTDRKDSLLMLFSCHTQRTEKKCEISLRALVFTPQ